MLAALWPILRVKRGSVRTVAVIVDNLDPGDSRLLYDQTVSPGRREYAQIVR